MPAEQDSPAIIAALDTAGVRFVLIGGLAAIINGSPFPTEDVDVTPQRSTENLGRLSTALHSLGARVFTVTEPDGMPFSHDAKSLGDAGVWNLVTDFGRLDISFVPNGTEGFDDLDNDATSVNISGVEIRVASLADIIRSKQAANRPKDQRVLPTLREILASRNPRNHPLP